MAEYLTEKELCEWLKISRSTAVRLRRKGMPFVKIGKRFVRYNKEEVEKWLSKQK